MSMGVSGEETGAVRGNSRERDGAQSQGTWPRAGASVLEGGSLDSLSSPALPLAAQGCPPTATYWGPSLPQPCPLQHKDAPNCHLLGAFFTLGLGGRWSRHAHQP